MPKHSSILKMKNYINWGEETDLVLLISMTKNLNSWDNRRLSIFNNISDIVLIRTLSDAKKQ